MLTVAQRQDKIKQSKRSDGVELEGVEDAEWRQRWRLLM